MSGISGASLEGRGVYSRGKTGMAATKCNWTSGRTLVIAVIMH